MKLFTGFGIIMVNRLPIIQTDVSSSASAGSSPLTRQKERQARFERLWLLDPQQFNPLRNWMQKERLERTWTLLTQYVDLPHKKIADIGCGAGVFSRLMRDAGAQVDAVDIAENALKNLRQYDMHNMEAKVGAMPKTSLADHTYDAIICTEVIAEIDKREYRLFFAELSRLVKSDGFIICSTPIDIYTDEALSRLMELAQTEFDLIDSVASYHALYLRLKARLEAPQQFITYWKNSALRQQKLQELKGMKYAWFYLQTTSFLVWMWFLLAPATHFLLKKLKGSRSLLLKLESICQFIWDERGISHFIFIAKRRPLSSPYARKE